MTQQEFTALLATMKTLAEESKRRSTSKYVDDRQDRLLTSLKQLEGLVTLFRPPTGPKVVSLAVTPTDPWAYTGETLQMAATVTMSGGSAVGRVITWQTSAPAVATVSNTGLVRAVSEGTATITATCEGVSVMAMFQARRRSPRATQPPATGGGGGGGSVSPGPNAPVGGTGQGWAMNFAIPTADPPTNTFVQQTANGTIDPANTTLVTDAQSLYGTSVTRLSFPPTSNGQNLGGNAPMRIFFANGALGTEPNLYICARLKIDPRWNNQGNSGTKFLFIRSPGYEAKGYNHYVGFNVAESDSPTTMTGMCGLQGGPGGPGGSFAPILFHSASTSPPAKNLVDDTFHILEWRLTRETTPGVTTDGTIRYFVDGTEQVCSYGTENATGARFFSAGESQAYWESLEIQPTFGGGIQNPPSLTPSIWWNLDSLYIRSFS